MSYPTVDEFKQILNERPIEDIVLDHVLTGVPFVFRNQPESAEKLCGHLHEALELPMDDIFVVGSAKIGFSLNPDRFPRQFTKNSDIDVLIINSDLFDTIWSACLKWHYPRKGKNLPGIDGKWMRNRRKDLYWGSMMPDRIRYRGLSFPEVLKPLRDISRIWFEAFRSLSLYSDFSARHVSGLLYRSLDHAMLYQVEGLKSIRASISK